MCKVIFDVAHVEKGDLLFACLRLHDEVVANFNLNQSNGEPLHSKTKWRRLEVDWAKANVDADVSGNQCMVAVGGVIRSDTGDWIFGFIGRIGVCTVLMIELWAVYDALLHTWWLGLRKIIIELDNATMVDIIHGKSRALVDCALVASIGELMRRPWKVRMQRIHPEDNGATHQLAVSMRGHPLGDCVFYSPPI
ncbi:hypothetical protein V6N11_047788 [Hibiscus sabdariffa]|uniref:RNase H type-1 domain-containing protein n=1 Tax=Hibiscus sabdariffa TaxID=183260 RepID=A0ABR2P803_9ROSI